MKFLSKTKIFTYFVSERLSTKPLLLFIFAALLLVAHQSAAYAQSRGGYYDSLIRPGECIAGRPLFGDGLLTTPTFPIEGASPLSEAKGLQSSATPDASAQNQISLSYGRIPLSFEANQGQTDEQVKFLSRGSGYTLFLTPTEAVLTLKKPEERDDAEVVRRRYGKGRRSHPDPPSLPAVLRIKLVGANSNPRVSGVEQLPGKSNYFIGNDPTKWRTNIPHYSRVRYENVYPGVDMIYYGTNQRQLEYDFIVSPGTDYEVITLAFEGAERLEMNEQGDLVARTDGSDVYLQKPLVYQEVDGVRHEISGGYVLKGRHQLGFQLGTYDAARPLVIDPVLVYSTYLGGVDQDEGYGIAIDAEGNAYVTGTTSSTNFPTASPLQSSSGGVWDVFVAKLNPEGSAFVYSTYLGGAAVDEGWDIAVDASGNSYVTGSTGSTDFPTANPLQSSSGGGFDAFVSKLNPQGSALVYSTYLGGSVTDEGWDIAVDASGNAYVTGETNSLNFPTASPLQPSRGGNFDAFVSKLNPQGSALVYSTYLGGSGSEEASGITVDTSGNVYLAGETNSTNFPTANPLQSVIGGDYDAFVTKLNPSGSGLVYSTFLGGSGEDDGFGIAVDTSGNACVTGLTASTNFPTMNPLWSSKGADDDAFIAKLNAAGSELVYSTYLGGDGDDFGYDIVVDAFGNAYVTGLTTSTDFPTADALQPSPNSFLDAFVTKLSAEGSILVYSTYLGGNDDEIGWNVAVDGFEDAYVIGLSESTDFPTANPLQPANAGASDTFIVKINEMKQPDLLIKKDAEADTAFAIDDNYQTTPAGDQIETQTTGLNMTATYQVKIENDGDTPRAFVVKASESGETGWTVTYNVGSTDISAEILSANGYTLSSLDPDGSEIIAIKMTPNSSVARGSSKSATIEAFLYVSDTVVRDAVKATTTVNELPIADARNDQTVGELVTVALDGAGSSDPNRDPLTYVWSQTAGPSVTLSNPNVAQPTFTSPRVYTQATLTFQLIVNDGLEDSLPDTVNITVLNNLNEPPVADAGNDQTADELVTVTLDGTESSDPNGDGITYAWAQTAGPSVTLSDPNAAQSTFTSPRVYTQTTLTFQLVVNDGQDDSGPDTVNITVQNNLNESPVANAGNDQTVDELVTVTLDGTGSSDPNGDPITYSWLQTAGPAVTLSSNTAAQPTFTSPRVYAQTTLTFQLIVNDGVEDSAPDTVNIIVQNNLNEPPVADAGPDQEVNENITVTLNGSGSYDPNGNAISYAWTQTAGPAVTLSDPTAQGPTFTSPMIRIKTTLSFRLIVNDGQDSSAADSVEIVVLNNINQRPVAHAGPDHTVDEDVIVTLDGSGSSDGDDDPLTYSWTLTNGPFVFLSDPTAQKPIFRAPRIVGDAAMTFQLIVNDGTLDSPPDTVNITVLDTINDIPIADAGPDQTVDEDEFVTLDGSASSDPDNSSQNGLSYSWTQTAGTEVALSDTTAEKPTFIAPRVATETTFTFQLIVNDDRDDSLPDAVDITVQNTINEPPVADAGQDQEVDEYVSVTLDGSGSSDGDDDPLAYSWTQTAGPFVFLSDSTAQKPVFRAPRIVGNTVMTFQLIVNDGTLDSLPDTVNITVLDTINDIPVANAGPDQTVDEDQPVTLDGSGSSDPDNSSQNGLSYSWTQAAGTEVALSDTTAEKPTFIAPRVATETTFTFQLIVNDDRDDSLPDAVDITVQNTINEPPVADAGQDQAVDEYVSVTLDGSGSSDPNGDALTYNWTQTSGLPVTLSDATAEKPTFTSPRVLANAKLTFQLIVSDGQVDSPSDSVEVTVQNTINEQPVAYAGQDQSVGEDDPVTLDGSASYDINGDPLSYTWQQLSGPAATLSDAVAQKPTFTTPRVTAQETLTFQLVVNDGADDSPPDTVDIIVQNTINEPPIADAGEDQSVAEDAQVTLDGSGSNDPNGDAITYAWTQTAGPEVTLLFGATQNPLFTSPRVTADATLTFQLILNDGTDNSAPDSVDIIVQNTINERPVADAGGDETVGEDSLVTLDASGSSDPNDDTLSYLWIQLLGPEVEMSSATAEKPTFTSPRVTAQTTLRFQLIVNDGEADSPPDIVDAAVQNDINEPPIAEAGPDIAVGEVTEVTLDGSGSSDPNGEALTYAWVQSAGPPVTLTTQLNVRSARLPVPARQTGVNAPVAMGGPSFRSRTGLPVAQSEYSLTTNGAPNPRATFTTPRVFAETTFTFQLVVNDGIDDSAPDTVNVTVHNNLNESPTADAGDDQTVNEDTQVTLDGSGSGDPNGDALSYLWAQSSGPTVQLSSATTEKPTFTSPRVTGPTTLSFQLFVSDGTDGSLPDTVDVLVHNNINEPPVADAGPDQTVGEMTEATLDGSGSGDPNGDALTYTWTQIAGPPVTLTPQLNVRTAYPNASQSNCSLTTNSAAPLKPADGPVRIGRLPVPPRQTGVNASVAMGSLPVAQSVSFITPRVFTETALTFQLIVNDGVDDSAADAVTVTVRNNINETPVADAGPDQTVNENELVALDGSGCSDPNDEPLTYTWTQTAGPQVSLSDVTSVSPTFTSPIVLSDALLSFQLLVNDGQDSSDPNIVNVTIRNNINEPPAADPGFAQVVKELTEVTLDASGSSDPNGDPLTYLWEQTSGENATLSDPTAVNPTFIAPQLRVDGQLTFRLTVEDGKGGTDAETVNVSVAANFDMLSIAKLRFKLGKEVGADKLSVAGKINAARGALDLRKNGLEIEIGNFKGVLPAGSLGDGGKGGDRFGFKDDEMKLKFKLFAKGTSKGVFSMRVVSDIALAQAEIAANGFIGKEPQGLYQIRDSKLQIRNSVSPVSDFHKSPVPNSQSEIRTSKSELSFRFRSGDFDETAIIIADRDANGNVSYKIGSGKGAMIRPGLAIEKTKITVVNADASRNKFSIRGYCTNADAIRPVFPNDLTVRINDYSDTIAADELPPLIGDRLLFKRKLPEPQAGEGGITSLMVDLSRGTFMISGRGGDLSSLAKTPVQIRLEIGDFSEEATFITSRKRSPKGEKLGY